MDHAPTNRYRGTLPYPPRRPASELAPFSTLLANSSGHFVKPLKSRNAGRCERIAIKPVNKANEIDRRGNGQVLQMRFRQPRVARTTQVESPHPLRNGRLNPCSQSISLLEGFRTLELASSLECGILRLRSDDQRSAWIFARGLNTIGKTQAHPTISSGKLDLDQIRVALPAEPT